MELNVWNVNVLHISCAKILNIQILENNTVKCCDIGGTVNDNHNDFESVSYDFLSDLADENGKLNISVVKYILQQKDNVVSVLKGKVKLLIDQVEFLQTNYKNNTSSLGNTVELPLSVHDVIAINKQPTISDFGKQKASVKINGIINSTTVESEIGSGSEKANVENSGVEILDNSNKPKPINGTELWTSVVNRKQKRKVVVGNRSEIDSSECTLKGVPKLASLHVFRLDPETEVVDLETYLKPKFPEVVCQKLNSKYPDIYSSFRFDVYEENFEKALDPQNWPKNARIRRFLFPMNDRRQHQQQNQFPVSGVNQPQ